MAARKLSELSLLPEVSNTDLFLISSGTTSRSVHYAGLFANVNAPVTFNNDFILGTDTINIVANTSGDLFLTVANTSGSNFFVQLTLGDIPA